jgi:hypothetical protein
MEEHERGFSTNFIYYTRTVSFGAPVECTEVLGNDGVCQGSSSQLDAADSLLYQFPYSPFLALTLSYVSHDTD